MGEFRDCVWRLLWVSESGVDDFFVVGVGVDCGCGWEVGLELKLGPGLGLGLGTATRDEDWGPDCGWGGGFVMGLSPESGR